MAQFYIVCLRDNKEGERCKAHCVAFELALVEYLMCLVCYSFVFFLFAVFAYSSSLANYFVIAA